MGLQVAEAFVKIRPDTKAFGAELKSGVSGDVASLAKTFAGLAIGAAVLKSWRDGINELKKAAAVSAQTANAIRATGGAAGVTAVQVGELASQLSEMSGADDELIQQGSNLILTFKNVANAGEGVNAIFDRATTAALDLSTAGFGSMESASVMLGKALNDPIAGLTALQRAGVTFTASQKATITSLVETGQTLEAQKVILQEVESQVGGSARAFGETLPGQLAKAQVAMDNAKGAMLAGLAPALEIGAKAAGSFAGWIQGLPGPLRTVAALAITGAVGFVALARPVNEAITLLGKMRGTTAAATAATTANTAATGANSAALGTQAVAAGTASKAMIGLRAAMLPLAVAITGGAVAWSIWTNRIEAGKKAAASMGATVKSALDDAGSMDELSSKVAMVNEAIAGMQKDLAGSNAPWDADFRRDLQAGIGELEALRAEYVAVGAEAVRLMESEGLTADEAFRMAKASHEAAGAVGELGDALDPAADAADALAGALDLAAAAQEAVNEAIGDAFGAVTTAAEAALDFSDALRDMRQKILDANEAVDDQETAVNEVEVAHDQAKQSIIDYGQQTFDTYIAAGASAQQSRDAQIGALTDVISTLAPGSPLRVFLEGYVADLNAVPTAITTYFAADTAAAILKVAALAAAISALASGGYSVPVSSSSSISSGGPEPQASGGPVFAGHIYQVGEQGSELFVPAVDGRILSHSDSMGATSGGGTTIVNVTVVGGANPVDTGQRIGNSVAETLARRGLAVAVRTG